MVGFEIDNNNAFNCQLKQVLKRIKMLATSNNNCETTTILFVTIFNSGRIFLCPAEGKKCWRTTEDEIFEDNKEDIFEEVLKSRWKIWMEIGFILSGWTTLLTSSFCWCCYCCCGLDCFNSLVVQFNLSKRDRCSKGVCFTKNNNTA